ncbi:hypothetical protein JCM11251_000608 [Rhodosporidiobolus azoricus]
MLSETLLILIVFLTSATHSTASPLFPRKGGSDGSHNNTTDNAFLAAGYSTIPGVVPELPYATNALEPLLSQQVVEARRQEQSAVVAQVNQAVGRLQNAVGQQNVTEVVRATTVISSAGASHINYALFWRNLAPSANNSTSSSNATQFNNTSSNGHSNGGNNTTVGAVGGVIPDSGPLFDLVTRDFGSFENLQRAMIEAGNQGPGWLSVETSGSQSLIREPLYPLLVLENRSDVSANLTEIFQIVNWQEVEARAVSASSGQGW